MLAEGELAAGDAIERIESGAGGVTVRETCRLLYFEKQDLQKLDEAAGLEALALSWKESLLNRIESLR